jgi:hypothetical protein
MALLDAHHAVMSMQDRLHVGRVDASRDLAEMVEVMPFGDRPGLIFVDGSVGAPVLPVEVDAAVLGAGTQGACPDPAGSLVTHVSGFPLGQLWAEAHLPPDVRGGVGGGFTASTKAVHEPEVYSIRTP